MVQVGPVSTVATLVHIITTPLRFPVMVNVKLPAPPEVTETDAEVVDPTIVPLPDMLQENVCVPPDGAIVAVYVSPAVLAQDEAGPAMEHEVVPTVICPDITNPWN